MTEERLLSQKMDMPPRLLIINCPSVYFTHIPMGTFGLCDYLHHRKRQARILNLALYKEAEMEEVLGHHLQDFRPTHIGLVFHWQETAEGVCWVGERIRAMTHKAKIVCGGFTGSYFAEELIRKWPFVDYVVKGDPERPLELLLSHADVRDIPNLIYRNKRGVGVNEASYFIDKATISSISFSDLRYLFDYQLYTTFLERKLGFPLFIGRGCTYGCRYCGGSREAFKLHSGRTKPVTRSIAAIVSDLKQLREYTKKIYICYEIDRSYIKALFGAMKGEEDLVKTFQLNYGAWQLFDAEFLDLYKELFVLNRQDRPLFEMSPEVFDDESRQKVKHQKTYSIEDLKNNLDLVNKRLDHGVKTYLFFSRYHETTPKNVALREEIVNIFRLKHDLFVGGLTNVRVYYDHLSTDVGSGYWESHVENPRDIDTLISWTRRLRGQEHYSFSVDNLCIYTPKALSEADVFRCEMLVGMLKSLEEESHELFHILFACLGEDVIGLLEKVAAKMSTARAGNLFRSLGHCALLHELKEKLTQDDSLLSRIPFIEDLITLQTQKALFRDKSQRIRSSYQTSRPRLNRAFLSVHEHDYLNLSCFLKRLAIEGSGDLTPEKTVTIFLLDDIISMPYETYCMTLKSFETGISLDQYYALMDQRGVFDLSYHRSLVEKMFRSDVLY